MLGPSYLAQKNFLGFFLGKKFFRPIRPFFSAKIAKKRVFSFFQGNLGRKMEFFRKEALGGVGTIIFGSEKLFGIFPGKEIFLADLAFFSAKIAKKRGVEAFLRQFRQKNVIFRE